MPPKDNSERACEECIHYWACSRQCGEPMAQRSATGCECYETIKSSMAYYLGTLDGAKGKIPNRLRELAEADKDGRVVVQPCKVGDILYRVFAGEIFEHRVGSMKYFAIQGRWDIETYPFCPCVESSIGKTIFLTHKEAEKALQEMEGKKDGKT